MLIDRRFFLAEEAFLAAGPIPYTSDLAAHTRKLRPLRLLHVSDR